MKSFLTILFISCSICQISFGQVVRGQLVDSEYNEPATYVNIHIENTEVTIEPDSLGHFIIDLNRHKTLMISGLGFFYHRVTNNLPESDTIDLGQIFIIYSGINGHVWVEKKKLFSKKTKWVCKYIDETKNFDPKDLVIKCSNKSSYYTWKLVDDNTLFINLSELNNCQ